MVDETGDVQKGTDTVGVQRQHTGTASRTANARVTVYGRVAGALPFTEYRARLETPGSPTSRSRDPPVSLAGHRAVLAAERSGAPVLQATAATLTDRRTPAARQVPDLLDQADEHAHQHLGTRLASVHRARTGEFAPFLALAWAESRTARDRSRKPASSRRWRISSCAGPTHLPVTRSGTGGGPSTSKSRSAAAASARHSR